jgi:hypothetical protein
MCRIKEFLIRMKPTNFFECKWLIAAIAFGLLPHCLTAELLEQDFVNIRYNTSSGNGVPLSDKVNSPSGSNGLAASAGTVGQFGGAMIFGSAATPKFSALSEGKSRQSGFAPGQQWKQKVRLVPGHRWSTDVW